MPSGTPCAAATFYTRYSISQYIILLPTVTMEKGEMVMKQILGSFRGLYSRRT